MLLDEDTGAVGDDWDDWRFQLQVYFASIQDFCKNSLLLLPVPIPGVAEAHPVAHPVIAPFPEEEELIAHPVIAHPVVNEEVIVPEEEEEEVIVYD